MSILTELPVPTNSNNGVQSINYICMIDMGRKNRQARTDERDIQQYQQSQNWLTTNMDQRSIHGSSYRILILHLHNVEYVPHYQTQMSSFSVLYYLVLLMR